MRIPSGFTLAEVTVVIGLLGILVALGSFVSASYLRDQYLRSSGEAVIANLRQAQSDARTQANDLAHGIKLTTDSVVLFSGDSYAGRTASLDIETEFSTSVVLPGTDEISIPEGASGPNATTTVTLQNDALAIDITLTPYGVLSVSERTIGH